jgi:hypothetical protein
MTHHSYHSTHNRAAPVQHMKQCKTVPDPKHNPRHQTLTKLQGLTSNNTMQLKAAPPSTKHGQVHWNRLTENHNHITLLSTL